MAYAKEHCTDETDGVDCEIEDDAIYEWSTVAGSFMYDTEMRVSITLEATGAALHGLGTGAWSALKTATRGVGGWMSLNRSLSDLEEHAHGAKPMRTHQITAYDDIALRV